MRSCSILLVLVSSLVGLSACGSSRPIPADLATTHVARETFLPLHIANGVTGIRDMEGDCFEPCDRLESSFEQVLGWRRDIAAGCGSGQPTRSM